MDAVEGPVHFLDGLPNGEAELWFLYGAGFSQGGPGGAISKRALTPPQALFPLGAAISSDGEARGQVGWCPSGDGPYPPRPWR